MHVALDEARNDGAAAGVDHARARPNHRLDVSVRADPDEHAAAHGDCRGDAGRRVEGDNLGVQDHQIRWRLPLRVWQQREGWQQHQHQPAARGPRASG